MLDGSALVGRMFPVKEGLEDGNSPGMEGAALGEEVAAEVGADEISDEMGVLTLVMVSVICVQPAMRLSLPLNALAPQIWMVMLVPLMLIPKLPPAEKMPKYVPSAISRLRRAAP